MAVRRDTVVDKVEIRDEDTRRFYAKPVKAVKLEQLIADDAGVSTVSPADNSIYSPSRGDFASDEEYITILEKTLEQARSRLEQETALRQRAQQYSVVDVGTDLYNQRGFHMFAEHYISNADRQTHPNYESDGPEETFCIAFGDLNNFKEINDTLGHSVGDEALRLIGDLLKDSEESTANEPDYHGLRSGDIGFRYGGDEFGIIFPGAAADEVQHVVDKIAEYGTKRLQSRYGIGGLSMVVAQYQPGEGLTSIMDRLDNDIFKKKDEAKTYHYRGTKKRIPSDL